jgi:hypothetical protein
VSRVEKTCQTRQEKIHSCTFSAAFPTLDIFGRFSQSPTESNRASSTVYTIGSTLVYAGFCTLSISTGRFIRLLLSCVSCVSCLSGMFHFGNSHSVLSGDYGYFSPRDLFVDSPAGTKKPPAQTHSSDGRIP